MVGNPFEAVPIQHSGPERVFENEFRGEGRLRIPGEHGCEFIGLTHGRRWTTKGSLVV
jgi:hypothetical protein